MFFVQCFHNECEATLQIANQPVKSLEGGFMGMALASSGYKALGKL